MGRGSTSSDSPMKLSTLLASAALLAAPSLAQSCLYFNNSPIGTNINAGDDTEFNQVLPFAFPFDGVNYTSIGIGSNGYVRLGGTGTADYSDTEAEFLAQGPRIAVFWDDLNPGAGGGVYVAQSATQVSVVWKDVPRFGTSILMNMEVVLSITGEIDLYYDATCGVSTDAGIVGLSAGNGAAANAVSLSSLPTLTGATGYELFAANSMNLVGTTLNFIPTFPGYVVTNTALGNCQPAASSSSFGVGCPATGPGGNWYEEFAASTIDLSNTSWHFTSAGPGSNVYAISAGTGIDTTYAPADALVQGDDTLVNCSLTSMGTFPFNGLNLTSVDVCSNGFIWLSSGNTSADYTATAAEFATLGARLAPCWMDCTFALGGTFYWTQTAAYCMATWENVPTFNNTGSSNTFQCKLWVNGDIDYNYGTVLNNGTLAPVALVGIAKGFSTAATTPVDITAQASPLVDLNSLVPMVHSSGLAQLGANYSMTTSSAPVGSLIGVTLIGFVQASFDLGQIGAPGCTRLVDPLAVITNVLVGGATSWTSNMPIPSSPVFIGFDIVSQGAAYLPGINPLGVVASNGRIGTIGV
jgi:hypothetical protein